MDTFFTQKNCDRCGKPLTCGRTMSMLSGIPDNIDWLHNGKGLDPKMKAMVRAKIASA